MENSRLHNLAALFEQVRLKRSAIALACAAACSFAAAQDYGSGRDTAGSTRLYNLPLVSELEADPSNCVTSDAAAQAYAATRWAEYQSTQGAGAKLPSVSVYQCRTERSVSSVRPGEQLRDVTLGNIVTVLPSGILQYAARGTGTFEKVVAGIPGSPAPAPWTDPGWTEVTAGSPPPAPAPTGGGGTPPPAPTPTPPPAPAPTVWWEDIPAAPPPPAPPAPAPSYFVSSSYGGAEGTGGVTVVDSNTGGVVATYQGDTSLNNTWASGVPAGWTPPAPPAPAPWVNPSTWGCSGENCW